jgi:hypothetical protein
MYYFLLAILLCGSPLLGAAYLDRPLGPYLEFPPTTRYVAHAPFSWPIFCLLLLVVTAVCLPFLYRFAKCRPASTTTDKGPFPWWGWLGVFLTLGSWTLAWNRFSFFADLQRFTFFPLWAGYILVINGLTFRRRGKCFLCARPKFFLALFPLSGLFWWYFEYLNRFVQNWHYLGGGNVSAAEYLIHASICFSTVLPAVLSTHELLATSAGLNGAFIGWLRVPVPGKKGIGLFLLSGAVLSLSLLAVFPDYLFPLVWISPLLVIVGTQLVSGQPTLFNEVEQGDWRQIVLPALAALICGFFWEMWNWKSLAHWQYSVPFVHRYPIFAMPLPGYAGYLPFGLECLAAATLLQKMKVFAEEKKTDS